MTSSITIESTNISSTVHTITTTISSTQSFFTAQTTTTKIFNSATDATPTDIISIINSSNLTTFTNSAKPSVSQSTSDNGNLVFN